MARTNNLTNFLTDVATAIKSKLGTETPIPASQFDTKIGEIETGGTYQVKSITIQSNGSQTITPDSGYDALSSVAITVQVPVKQLQSKSYEFTDNTHIVLSPETGYDGFSSIDLTINVPGSQINNQDKTITQNGQYAADSGYTGLGTVIVNVPSGSGDVKLFETEEEMQADTTAQEGDKAIVYRKELKSITQDSEFSSCIFPNVVVLDEELDDDIDARFESTSEDWFDGDVSISSSDFSFNGYGKSGEIRVEYKSEDGITYTRTDGGEELQEFGTTIRWLDDGEEDFNSVIGNFMKISGNYFEGLYEYKHISKGSFIPTLDITKQNILAAVNGDTVANANTNTIYVMNKYTELNSAYAGILIQNSSLLKTYKDSQGNTVNIRLVTEAVFYDPGRIITVYNNDVYLCDQASYNADDLVAGWDKGYYTLQNDTITFHKATTGSDLQLSIKPGSGYWVNGQILSGQSFILSSISTNNASMLDGYMVLQGAVSIYDVTSSAFTSHSITNNSISVEEWGYVIADTQLTLSQANQLLPDIIGYGKNGIIVGDGTIYNRLDYNKIFNFDNVYLTVYEKNVYGRLNNCLCSNKTYNKLLYLKRTQNGEYLCGPYRRHNYSGGIKSPTYNSGYRMYYDIGNRYYHNGIIYNSEGVQLKTLFTTGMVCAIVNNEIYYIDTTDGKFYHYNITTDIVTPINTIPLNNGYKAAYVGKFGDNIYIHILTANSSSQLQYNMYVYNLSDETLYTNPYTFYSSSTTVYYKAAGIIYTNQGAYFHCYASNKVTTENRLYYFNPTTKTFSDLGQLSGSASYALTNTSFGYVDTNSNTLCAYSSSGNMGYMYIDLTNMTYTVFKSIKILEPNGNIISRGGGDTIRYLDNGAAVYYNSGNNKLYVGSFTMVDNVLTFTSTNYMYMWYLNFENELSLVDTPLLQYNISLVNANQIIVLNELTGETHTLYRYDAVTNSADYDCVILNTADYQDRINGEYVANNIMLTCSENDGGDS